MKEYWITKHPHLPAVQVFDSDDAQTARLIGSIPNGEVIEILSSPKVIKTSLISFFSIIKVQWGDLEGWVNTKWIKER